MVGAYVHRLYLLGVDTRTFVGLITFSFKSSILFLIVIAQENFLMGWSMKSHYSSG